MSILHAVFGLVLVGGYLAVEQRGMVFSGTDERPAPPSVRGGSGRGSGGGVFFFGSGYRGGK